MRANGFRTEAVDPGIEAIASRDWLARNAFGVLRTTLDVLCRRAVIEVDDLRRAIANVRPDAIIVDANCWGAMSMAEASGVGWLVFSPFTPYLRSRAAPPFGPGLRPLPGVAGKVRDASVRPIVSQLFDHRIVPRLKPIRAGLGVAGVTSVDELMRRAPLLLAVGGEPFEYPASGFGRLGALHRRLRIRADTRDRAGLAGRHRPADRVTQYVLDRASGRRAGPYRFASVCRRAGSCRRDVRGGRAPRAAGGPQRHVVPIRGSSCGSRSRDLRDHPRRHGGHGEGAQPRCPGLRRPFARDQAEVARRVQMARCGTRLPARKLTAGRLRAAVCEAITMGAGARRVAADSPRPAVWRAVQI